MQTWQAAALQSAAGGISADLFWQWGESSLSIGTTSQDGNTVYYGSDLATCMVTEHVAAIKSL
jgi:mannan endo-1,4-beta-mannosidase